MNGSFQFVLDHMVKSLDYDGSPLLSSAAPFERLNQVLGRGTSVYTTRTVINMSKRFLALQKSVSQCTRAVRKVDCPVQFPTSMKAVGDESSLNSLKIDYDPFAKDEEIYLKQNNLIDGTFR